MAVVIDNPEMLGRIEQLSAALGKPAVASVDEAVIEKLDQVQGKMRRRIDWNAIRAIQDRVAQMPILDDRSDDELLGYNEVGTFD